MWYSRMTWCLLVPAKYLRFLLQKKTKFNGMFLEWSSFIPTMAKYLLFMIKPSTYAPYSVLSLVKFLDRCREMFHASKTRIQLHPPNKADSHTENLRTISFFHATKNTRNLRLRVAPIYPPNKNANISPWELRISYIPCIWYNNALFHFRQKQRNGL